MSRIFVAAFLCLARITPVLAGVPVTTTASVVPGFPTTADSITIALAGLWSDACAPDLASAAVNASMHTIDISLFTITNVECAQVITPWQKSVTVGPLAAGVWRVNLATIPPIRPLLTFNVFNAQFAILGALSRKVHGAAGAFDIPVPFNLSAFIPAVECRQGGVTQVIVCFGRTPQAADGTLDTEVSTSSGIVSGLSLVDRDLVIHLSQVPNETCLTLTLSGLVDAITGQPLLYGNQVSLWSLVGDTTANGTVSLSDAILTRNKISGSMPLCASSARFDIDLSGGLTSTDAVLVKSFVGDRVPCR